MDFVLALPGVRFTASEEDSITLSFCFWFFFYSPHHVILQRNLHFLRFVLLASGVAGLQ